MKKLTGWFLLTSLCATTAVAMDEVGGAAPAVEVVPDVVAPDAVELTAEVTTLEVTTLEVTSNDLIATTGIADSGVALEKDVSLENTANLEDVPIQTFGGAGGDEVLMFSTATRGGEGDIQPNFRNLSAETAGPESRSVVGNPSLLGEHRDRLSGGRERNTSEAGKKPGFLSWFKKDQSPAVKTTDRAKQLAEIDRMRDQAMRVGDRGLVQKADRLEAQLKAQPVSRVTK
jgi:hypothetical protein